MFSSTFKKVGLNWAILCLVFSFVFLFVAGASASSACSKACKAKGSSHTCAGHSEASTENSKESSGHSQSASTSQTAEKQTMSCGQHGSVAIAPDKLTVKEKYTCPMHPELMKGKAGKCSKCGMNLEKKEFYQVYTCPMEGCPYMSEKGGKCSGCEMKLKKKLVSKEDYQDLTQPQMAYTCPMHPEVSSDKPGNCPKCGMKLEMKKTASPE